MPDTTPPFAPAPRGAGQGVGAAAAAGAVARQLAPALGLVAAACLVLALTLDAPLARLFKATISGSVKETLAGLTDIGLASWWFGLALIVLAGALALTRLPTVAAATAARAARALRAALFLLAVMAVSGVIVTLAKHAIGRFRPSLLFREDLYGAAPFSLAAGAHSFPSGHSQAIFAAMTTLSLLFPRHRAAFLTLAVTVAASRVLLTVHFLSDAVMGAFVGIATALILQPLFTAGPGTAAPPTPPAVPSPPTR